MSWIITTTQNNVTYYLKQVVVTGRAVWTPNKEQAIRYNTERAASYVIKHAGLKNISIQHIT